MVKESFMIFNKPMVIFRCSTSAQYEVRITTGQPEGILSRSSPTVAFPQLQQSSGGRRRGYWSRRPVLMNGLSRHTGSSLSSIDFKFERLPSFWWIWSYGDHSHRMDDFHQYLSLVYFIYQWQNHDDDDKLSSGINHWCAVCRPAPEFGLFHETYGQQNSNQYCLCYISRLHTTRKIIKYSCEFSSTVTRHVVE